jgi:hypothetical protein
MTDPADIASRYLEAWNERDAEKRRALIATLWADDASFRDPIMSGEGLAGVDAVIEGVQNRFPDFRFRQMGAADGFGDHVRFSWGPRRARRRSRARTSASSRPAA